MAKKEDLRLVRTNKKLFETFFRLLREMSIDDMSITEICDAAQVNRTTFYKHFNDRDAFVIFCVGQKLREMRYERTGKETMKAVTLYEDALREMYAFLRFVKSINADTLTPDSQAIRLLYDGLMHFYFDEFFSYFRKTKKYETVSADIFAVYRVGSLLSIAFYSFMQGDALITEQACEKVIDSLVSRINDENI